MQATINQLAIVPLDREPRAAITTAEAAIHLNRKPQTLRLWACHENGLIRPIAALPSRLQDQISSSPEYAAARPPASVNLAAPAPAVSAGAGFDDMDSDVPF